VFEEEFLAWRSCPPWRACPVPPRADLRRAGAGLTTVMELLYAWRKGVLYWI
jgi:hypothetical protein